MEEKELLVIDTDAGGDDAAAILLALSSKTNFKVLAVTCCFGNTSVDNVSANVMRILTVCNEKEIPIFRGSAGPLINSTFVHHHHVFGLDGLGNVAHEFSTGDLKESPLAASLALVRLAEKYPNKIHLVAIGPLTNIAMAHRIDPRFTKNLKSIMIMGGNYKSIGNITEVAEFNFYLDPESAHIVLTEATCPTTLVPWETAHDYGIIWDDYEKLIQVNTPKGKFVKRVNEYYVTNSKKKGNQRYFDVDFLAMAALLYPQSVKDSIERYLAVETTGTYTRGQTILLRNKVNDNQKKIRIITLFEKNILNELRLNMLKD